jgi:hypothetical protein
MREVQEAGSDEGLPGKEGGQVKGLLVFLFALPLFGQESNALPDRTSPAVNARFQMVQSPILARLTFLLDTWTGDIWNFVVDKNGNNSWEKTLVKTPNHWNLPAHQRFQIFLSGRLARVAILLDNDTGMTWQYVASSSDPQSEALWQPLDGVNVLDVDFAASIAKPSSRTDSSRPKRPEFGEQFHEKETWDQYEIRLDAYIEALAEYKARQVLSAEKGSGTKAASPIKRVVSAPPATAKNPEK